MYHVGFLYYISGSLFRILATSRPNSGPEQPHIQCVPATPSLVVKRPVPESDNSLSSKAEVTNERSDTYARTYMYSRRVCRLLYIYCTSIYTSLLCCQFPSTKVTAHSYNLYSFNMFNNNTGKQNTQRYSFSETPT